MHQAVLATPTQHTTLSEQTFCAAGHRSKVASTAGLIVRFSVAAVLFALGARMLSTLALLPVAWTLISVAAGIVAATFFQHANHLRGVCVDCEDELV